MTATAQEKRIKRRVTARVQRFFASCAPGLSLSCLAEIRECLPDVTEVVQVEGGVEFQGRVQDCYLANLSLRSPSRITLRLVAFKAENFRTLEKKLKAIEWDLYLDGRSPFRVEVSARKCRLYHTDAVSQRAEQIIRDYLDACIITSTETEGRMLQTVFIRGMNDHFELSLDSSGPLLHKRGLKHQVGGAPIRETIASSILRHAGYTGSEMLLDPMCGSGTFSLEAAMIRKKIPPGFFRNFAFESWPCFSPGMWKHLKQTAESGFSPEGAPSIFASDLDRPLLESLEDTLRQFGLVSEVRVDQQDFFQLIPGSATPSPGTGIVVLNPPYGLRLGSQEDCAGLFREIGKKLLIDFRGWRVGIVLPDKGLLTHLPIAVPRLSPYFHGGLDITVVTGVIA